MSFKSKIFVFYLFISIEKSFENCSKFRRDVRSQHRCVLTPEATEGPFYLPRDLIRRDVREDREGIPFVLTVRMIDVRTCEPLANISFDLWHCDSMGLYSSYINAVPSSDFHEPPTDNTTFLRGRQFTDKYGVLKFKTIFPGWYGGRPTHIHIQSHLGANTVHSGQLYFDNKLVDMIAQLHPYNRSRMTRIRNEEDSEYMGDRGGDSTIHRIQLFNGNRLEDGFRAQMTIGVNTATNSSFALYGRTSR